MKKNSFVLLNEYYDSVKLLTDEEAGKLFKAIFLYETQGTETDFQDRSMKMLFMQIKRFMDINKDKYTQVCKKRSEAINKRWSESKTNKNENTSVQLNTNETDTATVTDTDTDTGSVTDTEAVCISGSDKKDHTNKVTFGVFENILLTKEEYEKLQEKYPSDCEERIDSMSAYIKSTGKVYSDCFAQLINWKLFDKPSVNRKGIKPKHETSYDIDKYMKKALDLKNFSV